MTTTPKGLPEFPLLTQCPIAVAPAPTDSNALRRGRVRAGVVIPRDAARARWKGEALDLDLAITAMASLDERHRADERDPADRFDGHG
ncbi:MAG: hypothetical protein ACXW2Y_02815 [Acidimicrobiia bacterium]